MDASSSSSHSDVGDDDCATATWKNNNVDKLNGSQHQFCLLDHSKYWEIAGLSEDKIRRNPRLMKLMKQPKNQIVELPDPIDVARQFYCANCKGIPFPWAPDSRTPLAKEDNEEPVSHAVYLCRQGHPICRTCCDSFHACSFDKIDYTCVYNPKRSVHRQQFYHTCPDTIGELDEWKETCLLDNTKFKCMFLTKMVRSTEFACKYFYNWCAFRGRGSELQNHEQICPHAKTNDKHKIVGVGIETTGVSRDDVRLELEDQKCKNDDCEILKLSFDDIVLEGRNIMASTLETHRDEIDTTTGLPQGAEHSNSISCSPLLLDADSRLA